MERALSMSRLSSKTLQTLVIRLGAADNGELPSSCSREIYAQVLKWFQLGQPEFSQAIHDSQESPISLSSLMGWYPGRELQEGDEFYFRIGLLNGNLIEPLLRGMERYTSLTLCSFPFVIKNINLMPGSNPLVKSSDYALLAQMPSGSPTLTLRFLSPTSFKFKGRHIQPMPLPELVFGSLLRRWNAFAPKELKFLKIPWNGLICDYELKTQTLTVENIDELGSIGWVRYRFLDTQQARIAAILANFASFAGVGRKTTMGMGQVMVEDS